MCYRGAMRCACCTLRLLTGLGAEGSGCPLLFAEVSPFAQAASQDAERAPLGQGPNRNWTSNARPGLAQGQGCPQRTLTDARDGEGQSPSAVPWDKRVNRGNPTQEGEQAGVAARLVTFLWPRKEKSLAKPRSGGETPPRTESSCPARRSRAIEAWGGIRQAMTLPTPHPNPLPQGERGSNRSR